MPFAVRLLTPADQSAAWTLGSVAFGYHDQPMPESWAADRPGRRTWGAFDETGRLVAKALDREHSHWFGGRVVPAAGVAGVVVAPEWRGSGLVRLVLTRLLAEARERGAVISTLFDTIPFPYRAVGYEEVGAMTWRTIPTLALAGIRPAPGITLRPAEVADVPALWELYRSAARASNGLMERAAPVFSYTPEQYLA
ncbi:MAG TPA: GNAT family N-acetyltransferase, partial [Micromonosporaceae bacterium]